jgi:hypothetical protein
MDESHGSDEHGEKALHRLCSLVSARLLHDSSFVDSGFQIEFHGGAEDFAEKVSLAVRHSVDEMSKHQLFAILMRKTRAAKREIGENVIIDDEPPPGFSSS